MKNKINFSQELLTFIEYMNRNEFNIINIETHNKHKLNLYKLFDLAIHHRLYPVLLKATSKTDYSNPLYRKKLHELRALNDKNNFYMMKLSGELAILSKKLNEIRVPHLCLKGPVLAQKIYGDLSLRTSKDLDILVPYHHLCKVARTLWDHGYRPVENEGTVEELFKKKRHHKTYVHPLKNISVELHWSLHPNIYTEPSFHQLWERRAHVNIAGVEVPMLGNTDLFIYLSTHGARHAWFRLRWLYDIHMLLQHSLDFHQIQHLAKELKVEHMVGQAIQLTHDIFESQIPEELETFTPLEVSKKLTSLAKYIISKDTMTPFPFEGKYLLEKRYQLLLRRQGIKKREFIVGHFVPTDADKEVINLPKMLEGLYFIIRPFLALVRRMRKSL